MCGALRLGWLVVALVELFSRCEVPLPSDTISDCSKRDFCTRIRIACMRFVQASKIFSLTSNLMPESEARDFDSIS
uniref:Putative secreted protein n=1 Tax=Anopheles darlingi TaxID=43151 RepID=A0A2M4DL82_ANODA